MIAIYHTYRINPCENIRGLYYFHQSEANQNLFRAQAAKDWNTFLLQRSKELAKGKPNNNAVLTSDREVSR